MLTLKDFNVTRESFNLPSDAHVVLFNRPKMPVHILIASIAGSRFDPIGKEGLAHFVEHMLLAGTKTYPTKDLLAGYMENLGGSIGASTGSDQLNIHISLGDPNDTTLAIKLVSDVLLNALFDKTTIEKERGAILRELESEKANPRRMLGEITNSLVYQNTNVGRSILGSAETINSITREDLLGFYKDMTKGSLLTIIVAGDLTKEDLQNILESNLALPKGNRPQLGTELPIYRDKVTDYLFFNNESLETCLSFRTSNIIHEDTKALNILGSILAGGRTGVLTKRLRYERGLVYSVGAGNDASFDGGDFGVSTSIDKNTLQEVLDIICSEIKRMSDKGPTEDELCLVKNRLIKSIRTSMQTSGSWVGGHAYRDLYYPNDIWTIEDYLKNIEYVTVGDVKRVAKKYLTTDNWYLSLTGAVDDDFIQNIKINL
jgi:predicted Zn-dependent peptidase